MAAAAKHSTNATITISFFELGMSLPADVVNGIRFAKAIRLLTVQKTPCHKQARGDLSFLSILSTFTTGVRRKSEQNQ
jgi:hypothetical protein